MNERFYYQKFLSKRRFASFPGDVDQVDYSDKATVKWFRDQGRALRNVTGPELMDRAGPFARMQEIPKQAIGRMYFFFYDPKHKLTLPYYDIFPLIFPIQFYDDGFLGLNLHYLPPILRAKLMDALMEHKMNNNKFDSTTKLLQMDYKTLNGAAQFREFRPCVHRYLYTHVRSSFLNVNPKDWNFVLMLPVAHFMKAPIQKVYADSINKIRVHRGQ